MPITSYTNQQQQQQYIAAPNIPVQFKGTTGQGGPDVHSQTSSNDGSSGSEHRRGFVSGYASMPITSYTNQQQQQQYIATPNIPVQFKGTTGQGGPDVHSQTSSNDGSSGSEHRRGRAILPPAPMPSAHSTAAPTHIQKGTSISLVGGPSVAMVPKRLEEIPRDLASSRQSFRIAMSQPFEFFVDNL
ncbi:unnamed protein product [Gongylonema pulchrum]|uniref:Uncharacterized protein n=1 Tax=Gongylonema pulchrum TaxID=637853 RepID=A0A183DZC4_9BILA|nr:unnamed protein product [Gongylonema pulchrum]